VAAGAALFTLAGAYGFPELVRSDNVDPMRVAAQVASGIGFVGAGAILRHGANVRGLTTAAALWTSAALGVAAGAGFMIGALVGFAIVLVALVGLRQVRDLVRRPGEGPGPASELRLEVDYTRGNGTMGFLVGRLNRLAEIEHIDVRDDGDRRGPGVRHASFVVRSSRPSALGRLVDDVAELPEVRSVQLVDPVHDGTDAAVPAVREGR
jgi:putative Mg2+ transporter-C (MgtC) family protein